MFLRCWTAVASVGHQEEREDIYESKERTLAGVLRVPLVVVIAWGIYFCGTFPLFLEYKPAVDVPVGKVYSNEGRFCHYTRDRKSVV